MICKDCGIKIKDLGILCSECEMEKHIREYEVAQANDGGE